MDTFQSILVAGIALGVVQLSAGVAIGLWLGRRKRNARHAHDLGVGQRDMDRAARLATDLRGMTDCVADSVRRHNAQIEAIDSRLHQEIDGARLEQDASPLTNLVVGVVGQMLGANQQLQKELQQAEQDLDRQAAELDQHRRDALTDPLTGLPNRRALDDHLQSRLKAWRTHKAPFTALLLDIDHFKRFNDTHGHQAGDRALREFGQAVSRVLRKQDVVARFGGEEFAVLLPYTTLQDGCGTLKKVLRAIHELRVEIAGKPLPLTASGGMATILSGETVASLIARADEALYAAKDAGRDRVYLHQGDAITPFDTAEALAALDDVRELSADLREACEGLREGMADFLSKSADNNPVPR